MQANSDRTPFIADLKPSGKYVMEDVHKVCTTTQCSTFWDCPQPVNEHALASTAGLTLCRMRRWAASRRS